MLHQDARGLSQIISSACGANLERRMLDKILYAVGNSDEANNYYNLFYHHHHK